DRTGARRRSRPPALVAVFGKVRSGARPSAIAGDGRRADRERRARRRRSGAGAAGGGAPPPAAPAPATDEPTGFRALPDPWPSLIQRRGQTDGPTWLVLVRRRDTRVRRSPSFGWCSRVA